MTTVRCPLRARPAANAALDVVLPTPPLPEVMTMTLANLSSISPEWPVPPSDRTCRVKPLSRERFDRDPVAFQKDLYRLADERLRDILADSPEARDGDQFRFQRT